MPDEIADKLQTLRARVNAAARRFGRSGDEIRIVLVSKTVESERIQAAYHAGAFEFGENRVQELLRKKKALLFDVKWHMIGHLQTNKVKDLIGQVELIHSLDRPELYLEIEKQAKAKNIAEVPCLIQVNSSGEESKFGLRVEDVEAFAASISTEGHVKIKGLMTIGPLTEDPHEIQKVFRETKALQTHLKREFPQWKWDILSMGMSSDFEMAIEEGSNLIRVGTAVFGPRKPAA